MLSTVRSTDARTLALQELARRELQRRQKEETFLDFVRRVAPRFKWYPHCQTIARVLQDVADGKRSRVIIEAPPRHGKTELTTRLFPAYYLHRHPGRWVGISSYAANLVYTLSRNARLNYQEAGHLLSSESAAVQHWETGLGGGLWAAGVGGPITGKGGHLLLIDDPIKNREEAESEVIREKQKDWYRSTWLTREEPGAAQVIIMTRWHEDDLVGWLLSEEGGEHSERWHVVVLPAIADEDAPELPATCTREDDDREPGSALCSERYGIDKLRKIEARLGPYNWNALYQQRPRPREGSFFKWAWFHEVNALPSDSEIAARVRYWDTAGTEGDGDYTVGVRMSRTRDGRFFIEDRVKGQWSPARRDAEIKAAAEADGQGCVQWLEREAGVGGEERSAATVRLLAGYRVHTERVSGSKEDRAEPLASQAEVGNVYYLKADWNRNFLNTLCDFPHGKHDDDVDAASGALNKLALAHEAPSTIARPF